MRAVVFAVLSTSLFAMGCASATTERTLPPQALVQRAWQGGEAPPTPREAWVVYYAASQIGKRYCWGGEGPSCYDCSGLVQRAWESVGVRVPRTADDIARDLPEVPLQGVRAGDILWWPGHVGIYAGNGWVIDALGAKWGVVRRPAKDPHRAFRPPAEWTPYDARAASL